MDGRLEHMLESVVFSLVAVGFAFVVAVLAKLILKKSIGTKKYYWAAAVTGMVIYGGLISARQNAVKVEDHGSVPVAFIGLDAPFIISPTIEPEGFLQKLHDGMAPLSVADKAELDEALRFLTWAAGDNVRKSDPAKFAKWTWKDVTAHSFVKLEEFAQDNGDKMTLRKYIVLANQIKKENPELVKPYTDEMK
jgi:hypothetical protein